MPPEHTGSALTSIARDRHEFDLHGLVGIRLLDATPADVARVRRQLGPIDGRLDREPDITVRFVDRLTRRPLTHVGLHETGFNEDGFFVLSGVAARPGRALIPFDRIGRHPEILVERSLPAVPHLLTVINLTALTKGILPLHASAFTTDGTGILVTGWSKGGKTESLLANMARGAQYVGDEWVYLTRDGDMFGIPEPIRLWSWQLDQLPEVRRGRPRPDQWRLAGWSRVSALLGRVGGSALPGAGIAAKAAPVVSRQSYLQIPPAELFGSAALALRGRLDAVVLVESHTSSETSVEPVRSAMVADRMVASLAEERARFMTHYRHYRFARPAVSCPVVEATDANEARLLERVLAGRPAARVVHPYPCDIAELGSVVRTAAFDAIAAATQPGRAAALRNIKDATP